MQGVWLAQELNVWIGQVPWARLASVAALAASNSAAAIAGSTGGGTGAASDARTACNPSTSEYASSTLTEPPANRSPPLHRPLPHRRF